MNKLKFHKQETVIAALVEGNSVRSIERMTGVHRDTILRLMVRVGKGCERLLDGLMRDIDCRRVQVDEIWAYVGKKQRNVTPDDDNERTGDVWTWVALDADTKLIPTYRVDQRSSRAAKLFINDLASRVQGRVQLSSDALKHYVSATEEAFGSAVDYGQIVKSYEFLKGGPGRYSPPKVVSAKATASSGTLIVTTSAPHSLSAPTSPCGCPAAGSRA
jgi:IS1 family transposase